MSDTTFVNQFTPAAANQLVTRLNEIRRRRNALINTLAVYNDPDDYRRPKWIEERDALSGILALADRGLGIIYGAVEVA